MEFTFEEIRSIGERRYYHKVAKKLFITFIICILWAVGCITIAYALDIVKPSLSKFSINSQTLFSAQMLGKSQDVPVTVENGNIYVGDIRLPEKKLNDFSNPFIAISLGPLAVFLCYFGYHTFKAGEAGTAFAEDWINKLSQY